MREYIFVQIVMLMVFFSVIVRIVQNIRVDQRINHIYALNRQPSRYMQSDFERLPVPVQKYLDVTGAKNRQAPRRLKINFRGMSRQNNQKDWWRFMIKSYINLDKGNYLLDGCMRVIPGIKARFIDDLHEGKGKFELYLSSMFKYKEGDGEIFDYNAVVNFLVLSFLSPIHLAQNDFQWELVGDNQCHVTYGMGPITVEGRVVFDEDGYARKLYTLRYRDFGGEYHLYPFEVQFDKYDLVEYCRLPNIIRFGWVQDNQFYNDANFEIVKYIDR